MKNSLRVLSFKNKSQYTHIHNSWEEEATQVSKDEWLDKQSMATTYVEYYSAFKRNTFLT